jgi:hypothetical protein
MAILKNNGRTALASRAIANTLGPFTYLALSTDAAAEVATGTTLTNEITGSGLARAAATCTCPSDYVSQWVYTWATITAGVTIAKLAIFNAATGGYILMEHLFPTAKPVGAGDTFTATVQMTTSA